MKGGTFDGNTVNERGGAVYLGGGATVEIAGGTFRNNKAGWGGGLCMYGKLNISDVLAEKNTGTAIVNDGSITISGGIFRENTSGSYSITAVTAWNGTLSVTGGTFTKNSGIAVGNSGGTVTISGGEIYDNTGSGAGRMMRAIPFIRSSGFPCLRNRSCGKLPSRFPMAIKRPSMSMAAKRRAPITVTIWAIRSCCTPSVPR